MTSPVPPRVPTFVHGLDELMSGGFLRGSLNLLAGDSGTGKTLLSLQYLMNGVDTAGENGLYVTFEEPMSNINSLVQVLGGKDMIIAEKLVIMDFSEIRKQLRSEDEASEGSIFQVHSLSRIFLEAVKNYSVKRVVIDSLTCLGLKYDGEARLRQDFFRLSAFLRDLDCTIILISDAIVRGNRWFPRFGFEQYLADSLVTLARDLNMNSNKVERTIQIEKMRLTHHSLHVHVMQITDQGRIVILDPVF